MRAIRTCARRPGMVGCERGGLTSAGLFVVLFMVMMGGLAVDYASYVSARTQLQIAADNGAHAALVARVGMRQSADDARVTGLEAVERNVPSSVFGTTVTDPDVEFGQWSPDRNLPLNERFIPGAVPHSAARVTAFRDNARGNALRTFMLRVIGRNELEMVTSAVFTTYQPICLHEGMVAEGRVDVQSNNVYLRGFCIHSNSYVSINQNNYFEEGTIVSMPDLDLLELPNSGFQRNEGLEAALRQGEMDIRILRKLDEIRTGLLSRDPDFTPDYVAPGSTLRTIQLNDNNNTLRMSDLEPGRVHYLECTRSNGRISVPNSEVLSRVVIVTNCPVSLGGSSSLEDVVLFSTSTAAKSVEGASGVSIGKDDGCSPGGGAQVLTMGGMDFPASLGVFGSQLIAKRDINFAARADGIQGASLIAGGEIDGTSNSTMARCNTGMEDNFTADYFRMAM